MPLWPPSPVVEDELIALAKEHGTQSAKELLESGDQPVPCRGDINQYPVIVDSDTNIDTLVSNSKPPSKGSMASKRGNQPCATAVFQDGTGLPTPPSSDTETRGRQHNYEVDKDKDQESCAPRSKSTTRVPDIRQSRPRMSRIHTDLGGDLDTMKARARRPPSPYSYTRDKGTFRVDSTDRALGEPHLPSARVTTSSPPVPSPSARPRGTPRFLDDDSSTDSERRSKKPPRFVEEVQESAASRRLPGKGVSEFAPRTHNQPSGSVKNGATVEVLERKKVPRATRAEVDGSRIYGDSTVPKSGSQTPRSASRTRDSSYASSADESVRRREHASTKKPSSGDRSVRRRSSHRQEMPRLDHVRNQTATHTPSVSSDDDATRRVYRIKDGRSPLTPPMVLTPHQMEDYFSKAWQENASKQSVYTPRTSIDETAIASQPTSPPRTPKTERTDRRTGSDYPPIASHRTSHHSRGPSLDDSYFRDSKTYSSLLSQATSTAAALASKASPQSTDTVSNAIEATFACTSSSLSPESRSRAPSPQRERSQRFDADTHSESSMPRYVYPSVPKSTRPSTRDRPPHIEIPKSILKPTPQAPPPQRNASWTGQEQQYRVHSVYANRPPNNVIPTSATLPMARPNLAPSMHRSQSASTSEELIQRSRNFVMPQCPRPQQTQGLRDWCTIRDIPNIDLCPTCTQAISATRYHALLTRSLDKPYNKWTTCSLSKPWIRIAFQQSIKQNTTDLSFVRKASSLPANTRPCDGSKPVVRTWWNLIDPRTDGTVRAFFACNACVSIIHGVFPDIPNQFIKGDLHQEKVCCIHQESKDFNTMVEQLDQVAEKCRHKGRSSAKYMQPFVDFVQRMMRRSDCQRDTLLLNRGWHFMDDLPEFTICEACYEEVVWPQKDKPIARNICKVLNTVPPSALRSGGGNTSMASCQLYSDRMRRLFSDVVNSRIGFDKFRSAVVERQRVQYRLTEMNRMYEEDQRMGWDRRAELEQNRRYWQSLE